MGFQITQDVMKIVFWISVIAILYTYAGYPLLLLCLAKGSREQKNSMPHPGFQPEVSLIIPVYNEEKVIDDKIRNLISLDYPKDKMEIIVVSDASTDRTGAIVRQYEEGGVRFVEQGARKGKAAALNRGLVESKNEIIVFSDASILLKEDALRNIVRPFSNRSIGCVSGEDYIPGGGGEGAYGRYELFLRNLESRIGSIVGASGCFYAQRKSLYEPFPEGMAPDFFSVLKTVEKGYRAVTDATARGFMQSIPSHKGEFQRKVRTLLRGMTTIFHFKHMLNPFRYGIFAIKLISHKLLRWLVGVLLILLFLSNAFLLSSNIYASIFFVQIAFYGMAIIGGAGISGQIFFRIPLFFSIVNLSTLIAWVKYLLGYRQEIWEPSKR